MGTADYSFSRDAAGQVVGISGIEEPVAADAADSFTINAANNQLAARGTVTATHDASGNLVATYGYDSQNRRIRKTVDTETIFYFYDINNQLIAETRADGTTLREYFYLDGKPLAMREYATTPGLYYYINDHLETPQQLVQADGSVVWKAAYQPFGQAQVKVADVANNLRYPGQYYDAETGLHYNWHRFYDPETGRYITADPIGLAGGMNLYAYVSNDPVNAVNVMGLAPFTNKCKVGVACKPETDTKKRNCPPGQTCDVDGIYLPNGENPYKLCDGCSIESNDENGVCTIGKPRCPEWLSKICQAIKGGKVSDEFLDKYKDWPRPLDPIVGDFSLGR